MISAIKLVVFFITAMITILYIHKKTDKLIPEDKFLLSLFLLICAGILAGTVVTALLEFVIKFMVLWNII